VGPLNKILDCERLVRCGVCDGKREAPGSQPSTCYSCAGSGVKTHSLFKHKESICQTCSGFGSLVKTKCNSCAGKGMVNKVTQAEVQIPRFVMDKDVVSIDLLGHETKD